MISIKQLIWARRYRRAIRKADTLAAAYKMKYFVIILGGKLKVVPKQNIKRLIREGRFKKGTTIADIESRALYITS